MNKPTKTGRAVIRRNALAVALAVGLGLGGGAAFAQSTTGQIFGNAESAQTIQVVSDTGITRTITVGADGTYSVRNLPVGSYTVNLMQDGAVTSSHSVMVQPGSGTQVNFAGAGATKLEAIEVSASALPSIDVSSATPTFTLSAQQLEQLPLGHSADSIALMAPGATAGSNYFGGISFGGSGVTENAYYVNGWNTTALYDYTGTSYDLPYGAIAQQQTLTGGYPAKYGRADGGVINQIGKRGTNEWHFGARVQWVPRSLRADPVNQYYPNVELIGDEQFSDATVSAGDLYRDRSQNKGWDLTTAGYIGGALVEDRLFMFLSVENDRQRNRSVGTVTGQTDNYYKSHGTKYYGKIDWNINDNNLFEYTILKEDQRNGYGETFRYDPDTNSDLFSLGPNDWGEYNSKTQIFHYTGYLTDAATISVLYGKAEVGAPSFLGKTSDLPYIAGASAQDPGITGGSRIINNQTATAYYSPNSAQRSNGLRVDFSYLLGDHLLSAGIDNIHYWAEGEGQQVSGPGYLWIYGRESDPNDSINDSLNVGAPGGNGYFVTKYIYETISSMSARQKAWYIQDEWQATPNMMVSLGLRNDGFENYNPAGVAFVSQEDQWEPRIGFTWDVNGDSSLKLWANAGRYFLALPQAAANRSATASTYTREYFTYSGIDSNGVPTGMACVPTVGGTVGVDCAGPVSSNGEYGDLPDPNTVAALNLKPQYQDEISFGVDKALGDKWVVGGNVDYRTLGTLIDDGCYPTAIKEGIEQMGLNPDNYAWDQDYCHLFNPNRTNIYKVNGKGGRDAIDVAVSKELAGLPNAQRDYYALNLYVEHPFDGTWFGRVDYTFSRSWGNSEGQVRSDIGQGDISLTEDWDYAELMDGSRGYLANHVRHQIKAYGGWQMTPEWLLSGTLKVGSGHPVSCLGFYGPTPEDPATRNPGFGYGSDYHWCEGKISPPGETMTPWTNQLDLGITYKPAFADNKLAFKAYVFNVLDSQKPIQLRPHRFERSSRTVRNDFHMPLFYQSPRYVRFTITYDY